MLQLASYFIQLLLFSKQAIFNALGQALFQLL